MSWQGLIVGAIVVLAALYVIRRLLNTAKSGSCGTCGSCSTSHQSKQELIQPDQGCEHCAKK